jgi:hypothetical protein
MMGRLAARMMPKVIGKIVSVNYIYRGIRSRHAHEIDTILDVDSSGRTHHCGIGGLIIIPSGAQIRYREGPTFAIGEPTIYREAINMGIISGGSIERI